MQPSPRRPLDMTGFWLLLFLAVLFSANNVLIKLGNQGLQPVFLAGVRSIIAAVALAAWMRWRGIAFRPDLWRPAMVLGFVFSAEFLFLFIALDHTSVVRASTIFYSMPIWLAVVAHFLFPGERLTPMRFAGFLAGFAGVVRTLWGRPEGEAGGLGGDLAALVASFSWAGVVIVSRLTRIGQAAPETQIFWQVAISAVLLTALAPVYGGPLVRAFDGVQLVLLLVQALGVVAFGFVLWFWLLGRYPSGVVASFSFLTPILSALLGWLLLDEAVGPLTPVALGLLVVGLVLINRR